MGNKIKRVALRDLIHRNILERILKGKLPPGIRIKDTEMSEEMEVSRTPVREALLRLVKEGFLENQVGKGFLVRPLTADEVREIYPIITALESLALTQSRPLSGKAKARAEKIVSEMDLLKQDCLRLIELDMEWHKVFLSGCKNNRLLEMISDLKGIAFRYEYTYMQDETLVQSSMVNHRELLIALEEQGVEYTIPLLEKHWELTMTELYKKFS